MSTIQQLYVIVLSQCLFNGQFLHPLPLPLPPSFCSTFQLCIARSGNKCKVSILITVSDPDSTLFNHREPTLTKCCSSLGPWVQYTCIKLVNSFKLMYKDTCAERKKMQIN